MKTIEALKGRRGSFGFNTIFPAGKYWIGDPCYLFRDDLWSELCNIFYPPDYIENGSVDSAVFEYDGNYFWYGSTAFGDGSYPVRKNHAFIKNVGVDAGCLSIIPLNMAEKLKDNFSDNCFDAGAIVDVGLNFNVYYNGGNFEFADFSVKTNFDDEEEDCEEEEEDCEEEEEEDLFADEE
jgi:hypothetical protein